MAMPPKGRGYEPVPLTNPAVASSDVSDTESSEESSSEDSDEYDGIVDGIDGDIKSRGCISRCRCFRKCLKKPWNCLRSFFNGYIPNNLYTIDFKLLFILTTMYTSLVTQFRQVASQQADDDVDSGKLFRINTLWPNNSISGGVSDRVLWNCRNDSKTSTYYKTLYLGLIILYGIVVMVYLLASVIINSMVASAVSKLKFNVKVNRKSTGTSAMISHEAESNTKTSTKTYLELVAKEVKITHRTREKLKRLECKLFSLQNDKDKDKDMLKTKISKLNDWFDDRLQLRKNPHVYTNWFTLLYIIPRFQTVVMICIITLTLTSYDIHPIGCLSNISISYNETEASVTLIISQNSMFYRKICILLIILLAYILIILKVFQYSLLPRSKWGLRIEKKCCQCCP